MLDTFIELTAAEIGLQQQVRAFLREKLPAGTFEPGLGMASPVDPEFSAALAECGWVGMAVPAQYGGHDATAVDRFVVVEELPRWEAPVAHHWVADRQIAPCCCAMAPRSRSGGSFLESAGRSCVFASA
jgi:alkylation response protein AidB-like acyl-CoA dehydrogenase